MSVIDTEIKLTKEHLWMREKGLYFAGDPLYRGQSCSYTDINSIFKNVSTRPELEKILLQCYGLFTIIIKSENNVLFGHSPPGAKVPLFYTEKENNGLVSDHYHTIEETIGTQSWSPLLGIELLSRGEIWGTKTLHPEISKLSRGMVGEFNKKTDTFEDSRYYVISDISRINKTDEQKFDELLYVLDCIFDRLEKLVNDKPVLLGLSGGYDSRLIALMLKRHEFEDVYTYTNNTQSNYDQEVAQELASELGFEWIPIKHTHSNIRQMYKSDIWWDIEDLVGGYGTHCPNPSALVTYDQLSKSDEIPNNAVRLSGLTPADGVHIPRFMIKNNKIEIERISRYIIRDECSYMPLNESKIEILSNRLLDNWMPFTGTVDNETAIDILTNFYIHKQDFSNTSIIADYFGFGTYHPFQDQDFVEYYACLPSDKKYNRRYLEQFTDQLNKRYAPEVPIGGHKEDTTQKIKNIIKQVVVNSPLETPARQINHFLQDMEPKVQKQRLYGVKYGFIPEVIFSEMDTAGYHYRHYFAKDALSIAKSGSNTSVQNRMQK